MLSGGSLFISATPTAQYVPLRPDTVSHYGVEKLHSPAQAKILFVCPSLTWLPPEDQLRACLICTACSGVQTKEKIKEEETIQRAGQKQDRMLIYANAVTQIWERLVPLVGL